MQADEEREHAMKFYDFILDCGGTVMLKAIDAPEDGMVFVPGMLPRSCRT